MLKNFATVAIKFRGDDKLLNSIYISLKPDNIRIPDGMAIEFRVEERLLTMKFSIVKEEMLQSLISTIDEVLSLSEVTINTVGGFDA